MQQVFILEDDDILLATDWCRPLTLITMSGGHGDNYSFESCYTGSPENNTKWVQADQIFGSCWLGKTIGEITAAFSECSSDYEFIRGIIPTSHLYGKTRRQIQEDYQNYLSITPFKVGKYKGRTFENIKATDNSYFNWAISTGLVKDIDYYARR